MYHLLHDNAEAVAAEGESAGKHQSEKITVYLSVVSNLYIM